MNSGIYKLTNKENGLCYIGQSKNFTRRVSQYKSKSAKKPKTYIENAIKKYGWESFVFEILVYAEGKEFLDLIEQKIISGLDTVAPKGYNLRRGGNTSDFSEETRKKMSEARKKYFSSPESRELLRIARSKQSIPAESYRLRGLKARGFRWMHNGKISCRVDEKETAKKLGEGFVFGRIKQYVTEDYKSKQRDNASAQWKKVKQSGHAGQLVKV